jgi:DNA-binding transcriptional LysR family regulator
MSDRLQQLSVFIRTAESGSFSRAARELGLSQPSVSRIIGELEERLGVALLLRTTRRITLTRAGTLFLDARGRFSPVWKTPRTQRAAAIRCEA